MDFPPHILDNLTEMNRNFWILVGAFGIIATLAIFQATKETSAHVLLPSDLASAKENRSRIRVGGRVTTDPIQYAVQPTFELRFRIQNPGETTGSIPVVYDGVKPDMFASGRDVIVDGDFVGGELVASQLLTQCPSKYEPPVPGKDHAEK